MRPQTLADLLELFIERQRQLKFSRCTQRGNRHNIQVFIRWLETGKGVQTPDRLQKIHLEGWLARLNVHRTWRGLPMRPQTINTMLGSLRVFLKYLAEQGYVLPLLVTALPYVKTPQLLPSSVLTHAQARRLLGRMPINSPKGYRNRVMLEVLYSSGLRAAELIGLNLTDIDYDNATLTVIGKGNKQRVVPIGRTALRFLETYVKAVRPYQLQDHAEKAVFLNRDGRRQGYASLQMFIRQHAQQPNIETRITAHTFRRSCATELLRGGANMYHVKDILGHESLGMMKHYAKLTITDLKKAHEQCHPREKDE